MQEVPDAVLLWEPWAAFLLKGIVIWPIIGALAYLLGRLIALAGWLSLGDSVTVLLVVGLLFGHTRQCLALSTLRICTGRAETLWSKRAGGSL